MSTIKIALLQMAACGVDQEANRRKGDAFCRQARQMGADLALFPEMWNIGYTLALDEQPRAVWQAQAIGPTDAFFRHFQALAQELDMAIALTYLQKWPGAPRTLLAAMQVAKRLDGAYMHFGGLLKQLDFDDKTGKEHRLYLKVIYYTRLS